MPTRGRHRRTNLESKAFKSNIIKLRGQNKSIVKIAREMKVSRQYVSLVLIEAGLGGRTEPREKREDSISGKKKAKEDEIKKEVSRLEEHGEHSLASWLQNMAQRRKG
ncbi:MAG TPA: hypothetical protein VF747_07555 [Blastocatellia bacterium]|jgi:cytochrome oxidase Cu insertion factor (SCO1/SenC/PrrC family)